MFMASPSRPQSMFRSMSRPSAPASLVHSLSSSPGRTQRVQLPPQGGKWIAVPPERPSRPSTGKLLGKGLDLQGLWSSPKAASGLLSICRTPTSKDKGTKGSAFDEMIVGMSSQVPTRSQRATTSATHLRTRYSAKRPLRTTAGKQRSVEHCKHSLDNSALIAPNFWTTSSDAAKNASLGGSPKPWDLCHVSIAKGTFTVGALLRLRLQTPDRRDDPQTKNRTSHPHSLHSKLQRRVLRHAQQP